MHKMIHRHIHFIIFFLGATAAALFLFTPLYGLISQNQADAYREIHLEEPPAEISGTAFFRAYTDGVPDSQSVFFMIENGASTTAILGKPEKSESGKYFFTASWETKARPNGYYKIRAISKFSGELKFSSPAAYFSVNNYDPAEAYSAKPAKQITIEETASGTVSGKLILKAAANYSAESVMFIFENDDKSFKLPAISLGGNIFACQWDTASAASGNYRIRAIADGLYESGDIKLEISNPTIAFDPPKSPVSGEVELIAKADQPASVKFLVKGAKNAELEGETSDNREFHAVWDTRLYPDGIYTLQAVSEGSERKYSDKFNIKVANAGSDETNVPAAPATNLYTDKPARNVEVQTHFIDPPESIDKEYVFKVVFEPAPESAEFSIIDPYGNETEIDSYDRQTAKYYEIYWNPSLLPSGTYVFNARAFLLGKDYSKQLTVKVSNILDQAGAEASQSDSGQTDVE